MKFNVTLSGALSTVCALVFIVAATTATAAERITTRWAESVNADNAHPEYPRPQMVREDWLNLNGEWEYRISMRNDAPPVQYAGKILVPFPIESALSGVGKRVAPEQRLWYRRTFTLPSSWPGRRILLHFGAVDWETEVWVDGCRVGMHRGGYDPFSFEITQCLAGHGTHEIIVAVWDPTNAGYQPRGKQVAEPGGIWYTPTTGIWRTVWIEPVPESSIESFSLVPDVDNGALYISVKTRGVTGGMTVRAAAFDSGGKIAESTGAADEKLVLRLDTPKLWSPDSPFLYDLELTLLRDGKEADTVTSYFGMRKISLGHDGAGVLRLFLNNEPLFQFGPLDQGFWPDGLYTAPSDEALRYDIEVTKRLGFNMARKHVKIEPDRWYYWCDKLGLLVWQDMPSGDEYIRGDQPDIERTAQSSRQYDRELEALVESYRNHPSIVMWVPFNEGWGQFDTERISAWLKALDPTRLVNNTSGWADRGVGDVHDIHRYPGPDMPPLSDSRAAVLGEFGGLGLPLSGHTWQEKKNWGYRNFKTREELTASYLDLIDKLIVLKNKGLAAAVYTQTTDVEIEVNGLMTYDREIIKMDAERISTLNRKLYER